MKKYLNTTILLICLSITAYFIMQDDLVITNKQTTKIDASGGFGVEVEGDKFARFNYEYNRLKNPETNSIPPYMRSKELMFAQTLKENSKTMKADSLEWIARGPYNIGGRTRAFVIDRTNEDVMIAGGVSSGVWKTVDAGENWYQVSESDHSLSITTLIQDPRPDRNNEWYYGTGEMYGASQSGDGAFYLGSGIYKSIDNGETWQPYTQNQNSNTEFNTVWQGIWRIAIDPSNLESTEMYVATLAHVYKTNNDGNSWIPVLNSSLSNYSYFTDVSVSPTGVVYAGLSRENEQISFGLSPIGGIWRSEDGEEFTKILPETFPPTYNRIVMDFNPNNENELYFLISNVDSLYGQYGSNTISPPEYNALWKYTYLNGDGTGNGGEWIDLSENLPIGDGDFDDFYSQGGYNLTVAYKPNDPNTVFIGGTNVYRSTDGFTTKDNTTFMGGYDPASTVPLINVDLYPNHHPDIHGFAFIDSEPDVLFSMSDGGVHKTSNSLAETVEWESLNNGYLSTQVYTFAINKKDTSNTILAGFQDNGTCYINTQKNDAEWELTYVGDGSYAAIPDGKDYVIMSAQLGKIIKAQVDEDGKMLSYERIDPLGTDNDDYDFINPFILDPFDNNIMYLPTGNKLWINTNLDAIEINNNYDYTNQGWELKFDTLELNNELFTAIDASRTHLKRLYLGSNKGKFYRNHNADILGSQLLDKTPSIFPNGTINCIASNPNDGNEVLVVFSNYGVYSLFHSLDGGDNWTKVAGNLEQNSNGLGNGPSLRWAAIHPKGNKTTYLVGTSIGLFSTNTINGLETEWTQLAEETIKNSIVSQVTTRATDDLIIVGTHGNGIFSANTSLDEPDLPSSINEVNAISKYSIYPNPTENVINISFNLKSPENVNLTIYDALGRVIKTKKNDYLSKGENEISMNVEDLPSGTYYSSLETNDYKKTMSFIKL